MLKLIARGVGKGLVGLLKGTQRIVKSVARGAGKFATQAYLGANEAYQKYRLDQKYSNVDPEKREEMNRLMSEYKSLSINDYEIDNPELEQNHPEFKRSHLAKIADTYSPSPFPNMDKVRGFGNSENELYKIKNFNYALNLLDDMKDDDALSDRKYEKMKKRLYEKVEKVLKSAA
ncbi:MAG: hypothetical protein PF542_02965 [Nanoarchaeota archaeon]|jgi:hypothetical protein|nr:hypothetical protein [Nanoarchaeota archaeon]